MAHPLLCWDIIEEGRFRRKEFAGDLLLLERLMKKNDWRFCYERWLDNCVIWENKTIIVTDPLLNIVLATRNMYEMNGYLPCEVLGKTPRVFQGATTEPDQKHIIRTAIGNRQPFNAVLTNYRKDGSTYRCRIEGHPVFNVRQQLVNFIALENLHHERRTD